MKASYDVTFVPMTNVSIETSNPLKLSDNEKETIIRLAAEKIRASLDEKLSTENIAQIRIYDIEGKAVSKPSLILDTGVIRDLSEKNTSDEGEFRIPCKTDFSRLDNYCLHRDILFRNCSREVVHILDSLSKQPDVPCILRGGTLLLESPIKLTFDNGCLANTFDVSVIGFRVSEDKQTVVFLEDNSDYSVENFEIRTGREFQLCDLVYPADIVDIHDAIASRLEDLEVEAPEVFSSLNISLL